MRVARLPRPQLLAALADVFRQHSFAGASLVELAAAAGLGKASLYQKFPRGKTQMGEEVLQATADWSAAHVIAPLLGAGPPRLRWSQMCDSVEILYAGGTKTCLVDAFSHGGFGAAFRTQLRGSTDAWLGAMTKLLVETGRAPALAATLAEEVLVKIQGALVLARARDEAAIFRRTLEDIRRVVP